MSQDSQQAITHVLQQDSAVLGSLLTKIRTLRHLNCLLSDCLGDPLAKHCQVANFDHQHLVVITNNAIWATQFRFQIASLLPKLRQYEEFKSLNTIQCKITPIIGQRHTEELKPRTMQRISQPTSEIILAISSTIRHNKLQEILQKIAKNRE